MRALLFSPSSSLYGAPRAVVNTAIGLKERGHSPTLAIDDGPLWGFAKARGVDPVLCRSAYWIHEQGGRVRGLRRLAKNRALAREFENRVSGRSFDLVSSHTLNSPLGAMLAEDLRLPHVWHMHEYAGMSPDFRFLMGIPYTARFIARTTDAIVVNSRFTRDRSTAYCPSDRIRLIYYGILDERDRKAEPPPRPPISKDRPLNLLLVGSIQERKGQEDAILALGALARTGLEVKLTLLGDGQPEYSRRMKATAEAAGVAQRVEWAGFHDDPKPFFERADIALVCSRNEPFGIITVESLGLGIPTIGADSGGVLEVIEDGVNGLLYRVTDPDHLASQILRLAADPDLRGRLISVGYRTAFERFGIQRYGREIEDAYLEATEFYPQRRQ